MVSKFPVTSKQGNEYRVSIREEYREYGEYALVCRIYIKVALKIFKNKERFKRVYKRESSSFWNSYDKYRFNYKLFAMESVEVYEEKIKEEREKQIYEERASERNLFEFENWDGKCE